MASKMHEATRLSVSVVTGNVGNYGLGIQNCTWEEEVELPYHGDIQEVG